jgi:ketosteroid isomerase-like protein
MDRAEKAAVLRDQYAAVNERDWDRAMSHYADDVTLIVTGSGIRAGTFEGKEAVGRWYGDWMGTFDRDLHFEITTLEELDDGSVVLIADHRARGRASGVELEEPIAWQYRLSDGKIDEVRGFESVEDARALARDRGRHN